jgi:hypothetical protein
LVGPVQLRSRCRPRVRSTACLFGPKPAPRRAAARVRRCLGYVGTHPAFVNAYLDGRAEPTVHIGPGYGDERARRDPTGRHPRRSRVGSRYLTVATFLGVLSRPLRLLAAAEYDTATRPRPEATDGRLLPWNLAITAVRL